MSNDFKPIFSKFNKDWWNGFWLRHGSQDGYNLLRRQYSYNVAKSLIPVESSVFDYACGLATISLQLEKEKHCKIAGCDISLEVIKKVNKKTFYVGDTITGYYDYIIISHFLEHITNPEECVEHCKEHGKNIVIIIPNNFRKAKEHCLMKWSSFEEFEALIKGAQRVKTNYPDALENDFKAPVYLIKK